MSNIPVEEALQEITRLRAACSLALEKIEQYCRIDFYLWLTNDSNGLKSDPCKRAQEAREGIRAAMEWKDGN